MFKMSAFIETGREVISPVKFINLYEPAVEIYTLYGNFNYKCNSFLIFILN